jgi:hypothetical protein
MGALIKKSLEKGLVCRKDMMPGVRKSPLAEDLNE